MYDRDCNVNQGVMSSIKTRDLVHLLSALQSFAANSVFVCIDMFQDDSTVLYLGTAVVPRIMIFVA